MGTNFEIQEIQFKHKKKLFYHEGGQTLAQVAQRGCGITILGDIQNSTGQGPEQGIGLNDLQMSLPTSTTLCDSVSRTFPSLGHSTACSQSVPGCYSSCCTRNITSFPQPLPFVITRLTWNLLIGNACSLSKVHIVEEDYT